ncbi:class I SAM-dependent methyltransferase [Planomonospora parontospora]|uniref:class I SAM-dependent methyltransferase n=1 Tax=Planomonospora parontospora TaxID=58119 RepID=UPI001671768D|nr:methyltransferase domain-containing protein [Planomonospora parontospora]GGL32915.1 methyltransferase [Planomonospora parontospora subsp. antibiotica]GII17009.1 methyltransferase [Planomonospora parontospora subsp. antibiotica]
MTFTTPPSPAARHLTPVPSTGEEERRATRAGDVRAFMGAAVQRPSTIGAMAPTGARVARLLATITPSTREAVVVELGAGTGPVSDAVQDRLRPGSRHLAVELDRDLAEHLRATRPGIDVVQGDAADLRRLLDAAGVGAGEVDAVVSALPWTLFDGSQQERILDQICAVIRPEAAFATISAHPSSLFPAAREFRQRLHERFDEIVVSRTVWRNVPPARVLVCRRPRLRILP